MNVYEAVRTRKSVRSFSARAVEPEKITRMLEAARLAPSAKNLQEWRFVVVTDAQVISRVTAEAAGAYSFAAEAPVLIVVCAVTDKGLMSCGHSRYAVDCAAAVDHLMLAAVEEGLGTCWIGGFQQKPVKQQLNIPEEVEVFALLPVGYPSDPAPVQKRRKAFGELVYYNSWSTIT
jgi:nitroreductase